jgi:hypothetical protein
MGRREYLCYGKISTDLRARTLAMNTGWSHIEIKHFGINVTLAIAIAI